MNRSKFRAALAVLFVGLVLGLSVFAVSRLFVRSVLSAEAEAAATELARRVAAGEAIQADGPFASVVRFAAFDEAGQVLDRRELDGSAASKPPATDAEMRAAARSAAAGLPVFAHPPLLLSLLGVVDPSVPAVAVPIRQGERTIGAVYAELDQGAAVRSLTQAFSVIGMVTIGLAVLATIAIIAAMRGAAARRGPISLHPAQCDPLTGLPARLGFTAVLADAVQRAKEADAQVGLMIIDLDHFRTVNDVWGHAAGDDVLKSAAERLRAFADSRLALARISGDNFALIVERDATSHSLRALADKIREALGAPYRIGDSSIALGASIGAAIFPVNAENAEILFRAADTALSKAKSQGRNALTFFDTEMKRRMQRQATLERELRDALGRDEFVVFYQPQLELATGRLRGYEALVRWERPGEGILSPRDFLVLAEETGLIRPLGEWVLRKACQDAATWLHTGTVAVNFSAAQFRFQDLDQSIAKVLAETGLAAERLEIEVPERLFLEHAPEVMDTLRRIKALGVRVAMDGFGAGYSSLASLAHFPFDKIKIDRSFVSQLTEDADVASIVASIVGLGRSLSVDITAEGVETNEQVTLLKAAGCSIAQGFLFGVPQRDSVLANAVEKGAERRQTGEEPATLPRAG